jgi:hypothetical protein
MPLMFRRRCSYHDDRNGNYLEISVAAKRPSHQQRVIYTSPYSLTFSRPLDIFVPWSLAQWQANTEWPIMVAVDWQRAPHTVSQLPIHTGTSESESARIK